MDQVSVQPHHCSNGTKDSMPVLDCKDEEDRETASLLPPPDGPERDKKGRNNNSRRKVQWNDSNGNNLVQVMEFQPSDSSESENEEENGACCNCSIM